jgi:hypothetical protein
MVRFCLVLLFSAGCAADTEPGASVVECSSDDDCDGRCLDGVCLLDESDAAGDAAEDPGVDTPAPDVTDGGEGPDAPPENQLGDPCDDDADCPSGYCIEVSRQDGQRVCTDFCTGDSCPDGWTCAPVENSGADRVFLCFPEVSFLCSSCDADSECGGLSDLCLDSLDGTFCGRNCGLRACPDSYSCLDVMRDGELHHQCVPETNSCLGCFDPDMDGYGVGEDCLGTDCDEENADINAGAVEVCDGVDNNCDGFRDEGLDLETDPDNCGACDEVCRYDGAVALCAEGGCLRGDCLENRYDIDARDDNGCEYFCEATGEDVCDGADNDCDGVADEDYDLTSDPRNCGQCDRACAFPHGVPACEQGDCVLAGCEDLYYDIDEREDNGCEYPCVTTNGGVEACDRVDNDCDGGADEGIDLETDVLNCGRCGNGCAGPPRREVSCGDGRCQVGACISGWYDVDGRDDNGCEYACTPDNGGVEVCDGRDNDCDGTPDNGVLNRCGACGPEPAEVCDGADNDCDGSTDEGTVCGRWIQSRCRLFVGWADNRRGPNGASATWGVCPASDRGNSGDVRCVGTRRDGRFARLQLPGDVDDNDEVAVTLLCDDQNNRPLASYVQSHCSFYLGHADGGRGVDRSPTWGDCPPATTGDNGRLRCTSGGFDGRFRAMTLTGDVDDNDDFGAAWICRDDDDPARAAALQASAGVYMGWADNNRGPADGSTSWGPCPGQPAGDANNQRCVSTYGDGLFHKMRMGGDVDDNDQMGWALRAR